MNRAQNRFSSALQAVGAGQAQQQQGFGMGMGAMGGIGDLFKMLLAQGAQGVGAATGAPASSIPGTVAANTGTSTAVGNFLNNSGVFDAIGGWIGSKLGGGGTTPVSVTGSPTPYDPGTLHIPTPVTPMYGA